MHKYKQLIKKLRLFMLAKIGRFLRDSCLWIHFVFVTLLVVVSLTNDAHFYGLYSWLVFAIIATPAIRSLIQKSDISAKLSNIKKSLMKISFVLIFVGGIVDWVGFNIYLEDQRVAKLSQEFNQNKDEIFIDINKDFDSQKFQEAIDKYTKYKEVAGDDFHEKMDMAERQVKIQRLVLIGQNHENLTIEESYDVFSKLVSIFPEDESYQDKYNDYSAKYNNLLQARERDKKIENLFSYGRSFDAEWYIKQRLNDIDSYQHVNTDIGETKGGDFVVEVTYRARNGFGAMILSKSTVLIDIDGNVLAIE